MSEHQPRLSVLRWWALLAFGTASALLVAWLARIAGVGLHALLDIVAGAAGLAWLIVLVAVPWNLYFAARAVTAQQAASERRGIAVAGAERAEAGRIARRMLWFALGGHVLTAVAAAAVAWATGDAAGYYVTGFYLLSAAIRPAVAYLAHLRERISSLSRESLHPRDDVLALRAELSELDEKVTRLAVDLDLRRTEAKLTDDLAHARRQLAADLGRLQDAQAADREAARSRAEDLGRRIDRMVRQLEDTVGGLSDHQELQAGLRALIRMIRADAAA